MLGELSHGLTLGQILSDEAVGVFIGAALPGVIRGAEVECYAPPLFDLGVAMELSSVVGGEGLKQAWCLADQPVQSGIEAFHGAVVQLPDQGQAGGPLDHGEDAVR